MMEFYPLSILKKLLDLGRLLFSTKEETQPQESQEILEAVSFYSSTHSDTLPEFFQSIQTTHSCILEK